MAIAGIVTGLNLCIAGWLFHTPAQLNRFVQDLAGTWSPSQVPAAGSWDWRVLRHVDRRSVFWEGADMVLTAKGWKLPEFIMTFMDQFISRNTIFQT